MEQQRGKLYIVGLGPGNPEELSFRARAAIEDSELIVGYKTYVDLIWDIVAEKELLVSGMKQEVARAKTAIERASAGQTVSLVSSGDPGIYGMAGLVFEVLREAGWEREDGIEVEVVPGQPALCAAASLLGAPLMHDFVAISLSDLLTPWTVVARRLELAAEGDFVVVLYNPKSSKRLDQLSEAQRIIARYRARSTPVGIVRCAYRKEQQITVTDLGHLVEQVVDMLSVVIIGNSETFAFQGRMVTPRGYSRKYDLGIPEQLPV